MDKVVCLSVHLTTLPRQVPRTSTWFNFAGNSIIILSSGSLTSFRNAIGLDLERNEMEIVADGVFEACPFLQVLDLSHNNLSQVNEFTFKGIRSLKKLDLSMNFLGQVDGSFIHLPELSRLDLSHNKLSTLTQFTLRDLQNLRYLVLSRNLISNIDRKTFRMNEKLMYLDLRGNPLSDDLKFQFHSTSLTFVDLSECNLKKLPRGLPVSVRYLQLRQNFISQLNKITFKDCPFLAILVMDMNHINEIEPGTFESMSHLKQLWLNDNNIQQVPDRLPPVLQRLLMRSNKVHFLSATEVSAPRLQAIYLSDNRITEVRDFAVGPGTSLPRLKILDLSGNRLSFIGSFTFSRSSKESQSSHNLPEYINSSIESLFLSRNPLQSFRRNCFSGLYPNLKMLQLSYISGIVKIESPVEMAKDLSSLKHISFKSSPHLVSFLLKEKHFWTSFGDLQELDLSDIEIEYVGPQLISSVPSVTILKISSSNWNCNSSVIWLRVWHNAVSKVMKSINRSETGGDDDDNHLQENFCFNPSYLRGRNLLGLSLKDFYEPDLDGDLFVVLGKDLEANLKKAVDNKAKKIQRNDDNEDGRQHKRVEKTGLNSMDYFLEDDEELSEEYKHSKSSIQSPNVEDGSIKSESRAIKDQEDVGEISTFPPRITTTLVSTTAISTTTNIIIISTPEVTQKGRQPIRNVDSTYNPLPSQQGKIKLQIFEKSQRRPSNNFTIFSSDFDKSLNKGDQTIFYFTILAAFTIIVLMVLFLILVPMLMFFSFRKLRRNRVMKICKSDAINSGLNGSTMTHTDPNSRTCVEMDNSFVAARNGDNTLVYAIKAPSLPPPPSSSSSSGCHPFKLRSNTSINSFFKSVNIFSICSQKTKKSTSVPKDGESDDQRCQMDAGSTSTRTPDLNSNRTLASVPPDHVMFGGGGMLGGLNGIKSEGPLRVYRWNDF